MKVRAGARVNIEASSQVEWKCSRYGHKGGGCRGRGRGRRSLRLKERLIRYLRTVKEKGERNKRYLVEQEEQEEVGGE